MPFPIAQTAPALKIAGTPLQVTWLKRLVQVRVDRGFGLVGRTTLRFVDDGYALASSGTFGVGKEVEVLAGDASLFKGEVTGVALEQDERFTPELVVTVDDLAHRLGSSAKSQAFLNQTFADVISKLVAGTGLSAAVSGTTASHPYLLQTGTDLAYLNAVTSRAGLVWYVDGRKLKVEKAGTSSAELPMELAKGGELRSFSVRASAAGPDKVSVTGWDQAQQAAILSEASKKTTTESDFVSKVPGRATSASRGWSGAALVAEPTPLDTTEAEVIATAMLAEANAAAVVARGTSYVNAEVKPGVTVKVANAGPASGKYLVSRVEHVYTENGFDTRFTAGPHRPAGLVDVLGGRQPDPGFTMHGVLPALVTDLADPDKIGRAKVKYTTISGAVESHWARLVTLGGGEKRGMVFTPEVNDEVLIAFEQGDTRRPVILGGLFSKKKGLPTSDDVAQNKVKYRRITSRLGHLIELADGEKPGEQHILLTLKGRKHRIRLGEDRFDIEIDKKPVTITNGQATIKFSESGDITLEGNNITIKAKQKVDISGGTEVGVKGTTKASLAGAQVEVKADGMGKVEAGGPLAIKGAMVAIN